MRDNGGGTGDDSDFEVESRVVDIAIEVYTMPAGDMTEGKHVNGKKELDQEKSPGASRKMKVLGYNISQGHKISTSSEV